MDAERAGCLPVQLLIVAECALIRSCLRVVLEAAPDVRVVGAVPPGDAALRRAVLTRPALVVLDLEGTDGNALDQLGDLVSCGSRPRVLVLGDGIDPETVSRAMGAGASGYLSKQAATGPRLLAAVRSVRDTGVFLTAAVVDALRRRDRAGPPRDPLDPLSEREREVFRWTVSGFSSEEIGRELGISAKTVETYRHRLMEKLGLRHRTALVRLALQLGILAEN